jgi:hypothetical protein
VVATDRDPAAVGELWESAAEASADLLPLAPTIARPRHVALADRTLGVLRRAIEAVGLWERRAVTISSDHGWRTTVWWSRSCWGCYATRFNTVVTGRTITAILEGSLTDPARTGEAIERFEQQLRLRS